jgi:hypothetical protein
VLFLKVHEDDSAEEGVFSITDRNTLQALLDWLLGGNREAMRGHGVLQHHGVIASHGGSAFLLARVE